ncbi:MAG: tRNA (adenosine(37)-N6)-threonylcarbamoyltransferase complex transferase subunit TsaD [Candidatus Puniceispirillaceae bacterium]
MKDQIVYRKQTIILGIESSCDETAAALIGSDREILSHHIASSAEIHASFGGVVPEIAARQHLDIIDKVVEAAFAEAGLTMADIDAVAATGGPGLIGGVLVGTMTAKAIAHARGLPFFAINHLEGHALTARLTDGISFPYLLLLVSGGHSQLLAVYGAGQYKRLGTTMDDAAGEAFDKGAAVLGLGYPGGPAIQKAAQEGDARAIQLPRPRKGAKDCHFSFSGLKTALAQKWEKTADKSASSRADFAASLQAAIADCLIDRTRRAMQEFADETNTRQLVIAGGVAANLEIGTRLKRLAKELSFDLVIPPACLCTDNAAMIAWAGHEYMALDRDTPLDFAPRPRWPLDSDAPPPPGRGVRI